MKDAVKIYKDPEGREETKILDLGIVDAGTSKDFTFYVKNIIGATLVELAFDVEHKEVKVVDYPNMISPSSIEPIVLRWSPSVTVEEGLLARLEITGNKLWGPHGRTS